MREYAEKAERVDMKCLKCHAIAFFPMMIIIMILIMVVIMWLQLMFIMYYHMSTVVLQIYIN